MLKLKRQIIWIIILQFFLNWFFVVPISAQSPTGPAGSPETSQECQNLLNNITNTIQGFANSYNDFKNSVQSYIFKQNATEFDIEQIFEGYASFEGFVNDKVPADKQQELINKNTLLQRNGKDLSDKLKSFGDNKCGQNEFFSLRAKIGLAITSYNGMMPEKWGTDIILPSSYPQESTTSATGSECEELFRQLEQHIQETERAIQDAKDAIAQDPNTSAAHSATDLATKRSNDLTQDIQNLRSKECDKADTERFNQNLEKVKKIRNDLQEINTKIGNLDNSALQQLDGAIEGSIQQIESFFKCKALKDTNLGPLGPVAGLICNLILEVSNGIAQFIKFLVEKIFYEVVKLQ